MFDSFYDYFDPYLSSFFRFLGFTNLKSDEYANYSELLIAFILAVLFFYIVRFALRSVVETAIKKTKNEWDDMLLDHGILHKISYLAPAILLDNSVDHILANLPGLLEVVKLGISIYYVFIIARVLTSSLDVFNSVLKMQKSKNRVAIKGVAQVLKIIIYVVLIIIIISFLIGREPSTILTGLGAASAIILLIFKDTILGFVGGLQLTAYDMVKEGDWISLPHFGADGTVIDISLTTVKVQNWDKTISTIPTYSLVSDSMKNWRGMEESGGRRIKRAVKLDMTSVKFCNDEMLERFGKIDILKDYLKKTSAELEAYNKKMNITGEVMVNGKRQTNLGIFRAYLVAYLQNVPEINNKMTFIVRQLETSEKGIPMEIYVFSKIQSWVEYEAIQSDIFDHILAAIPEFELRVFQEPTGADFRKL